MTFNAELAWQAYRHIEEHPNKWIQDFWRCETGMCYAGHVAMLAGARWRDDEDSNYETVVTPDGDEMHVSEYAIQALGLSSSDTTDALFNPDNELHHIKHAIRWAERYG